MPLKKNSKNYGLALLVLISTIITACSSRGCYDDMTVRMYVYFYTQNADSSVSVTLDSLSVQGVGSDSILYQNISSDGIELYLNPISEVTQFAFTCEQNGQLFKDTLTIQHTNQPWFQSLECGSMVFSTLKQVQVTGSIFNSAVITDSTVNTTVTKHVKLYL
jgi:hypothetical protein